jgi:lipid II:glycine glycyltransferase (peptidoglycan interpeptide bridge formation enzyme)
LDWLVDRAEAFRRRAGFVGLPGDLVRAIARAQPDRQDVLVLTAEARRERLAGVLFFVHGRTATYTLAWTGPEGRRLRAHNLLLWRAVLALRERGVDWLDLGGVNAAAAPGVARFKLGLGGRLHTLAGTFI